jgi:hypothetical protein
MRPLTITTTPTTGTNAFKASRAQPMSLQPTTDAMKKTIAPVTAGPKAVATQDPTTISTHLGMN